MVATGVVMRVGMLVAVVSVATLVVAVIDLVAVFVMAIAFVVFVVVAVVVVIVAVEVVLLMLMAVMVEVIAVIAVKPTCVKTFANHVVATVAVVTSLVIQGPVVVAMRGLVIVASGRATLYDVPPFANVVLSHGVLYNLQWPLAANHVIALHSGLFAHTLWHACTLATVSGDDDINTSLREASQMENVPTSTHEKVVAASVVYAIAIIDSTCETVIPFADRVAVLSTPVPHRIATGWGNKNVSFLLGGLFPAQTRENRLVGKRVKCAFHRAYFHGFRRGKMLCMT